MVKNISGCSKMYWVLCANDLSYDESKTEKIITKIFPNSHFVFYYIGEDMNKINNDFCNGIIDDYENWKFELVNYDIIFNEFYPVKTKIKIYTEKFYSIIKKISDQRWW